MEKSWIQKAEQKLTSTPDFLSWQSMFHRELAKKECPRKTVAYQVKNAIFVLTNPKFSDAFKEGNGTYYSY